jgi:hypothetical protein
MPGVRSIRLGRLLETIDRIRLLVAIGVILQRELAVRLLDVVVGGPALDTQHFVVVAFGGRSGHLGLEA